MREILFRGKRTDNGEWVCGYYEKYNGRHYLNFEGSRKNSGGYPIREFFEVAPDTVGQYTGLKDKNGNKIFEGDIVAYYWADKNTCCRDEVKYGEFNCKCCNGVYGFTSGDSDIREHYKLVVIGNIHDNPELLAVAQ